MVLGYRGKILKIDLSSGETSEIPLEEELQRQFIGGAGLACRLLYDMIDENTDPLGADNPLLFLAGPFVGTMTPTGSKMSVCARSPLTGIWGYSTVGGHTGADIRFAGYDGVMFTGQSQEPKYVLIEDDKVELKDASHLWGKDTEYVWETLKEETGHKNAGIARIGIAGENLVKYASIIVDHHRAAGRTGMGAVMGSKRLKAVVVKGTDRKIPISDPEGLTKYASELNADKKEDPTFMMYTDLGTAGYADMASLMYGSMPAGYYTVSDFDSYNLSGTTVRERLLVGKKACFRCPIGCGRVIDVKEGPWKTGVFKGPEYEVTGTMGTLILNNDLDALAYLTKKLDLLGIDAINGGNIVALSFYLFNDGKITKEDLDGLAPKWGDATTASTLLDKIANRDGIGNLMAEGSRLFAEKFSCGNLAVQVMDMDFPQHDPRGFSGLAVGYATSPRGACHMAADMYNVQMGQINEAVGIESEDRFANEADLTAKQQNVRAIYNSSGICSLYPFYAEEIVELFKFTTGWDYTIEEFIQTGERIFTMMRLMNLKLGYDTRRETLPELITRPLEGGTEGHVPNLEEQLDTWYAFRGWDRKTGKPSKEVLEKLGLDDL
ncbi:MAG: aldehyde ferredoxin oxidoreductase family protein [Candidatus Thorarchaeota archaeon]|nr:aldehyde ferredoxin oxidoreductase family protein [Candidatus Thorarchaeota archaeon]